VEKFHKTLLNKILELLFQINNMKQTIVILVTVITSLTSLFSQNKIIYLTENFNYIGGSMHEGDRIEIGPSFVLFKSGNREEPSKCYVNGKDYSGNTILNNYGFTVLMKDDPVNKRIFWKWASTDYGWWYYETQKDREIRQKKEAIEAEKRRIAHEKEIIANKKEWDVICKPIKDYNTRLIKTLDSLIDEKNYNDAANLYMKTKGNININQNKYESQIINGLNQIIKDTIQISSKGAEEFIIQNKNKLIGFKDNKYTFYASNRIFDTVCRKNMGILRHRGYSSVDNFQGCYELPNKWIGKAMPYGIEIGQTYNGGKVISIKDNSIIIATPEPIISHCTYEEALKKCLAMSNGETIWRLPTISELNIIFKSVKTECNVMFWSSNISDNLDVDAINNTASGKCYETRDWVSHERNDYYGTRSLYRMSAFAVSEINFMQIYYTAKIPVEIIHINNHLFKQEFISSTKDKPVYYNDLGNDSLNFYMKVFDASPECKYSYDAAIPKKTMKVNSVYESGIIINGMFIEREVHAVTKTYKIQSKKQ
jgi:hypothetical protein